MFELLHEDSRAVAAAGRHIVHLRNIYETVRWIHAGSNGKRPQHKLIGTEVWVLKITKDYLATLAILPDFEGIKRIDSKHIERKVKIGFVFAGDPYAHVVTESLIRQARHRMEWLSRCPFWPYE